ncbi:MAG: YD repeat-containing protein, partial [Yoonia sp.]
MPVPVSKYDAIGRLTKIENLPGSPGEQAQEFEYFYNLSGQRALRIDSRHRSWQYEYDDFGQLTNAANHFFDGMNKAAGSEAPSQSPTGSLVPAMQFGYSYDDIGNRTQTRRGGDTSRTASYSANQLNQITQRDVPGKYDIYGLAAMAVTPKVN